METYEEDAFSSYYEERMNQGKSHTFWLGKVNLLEQESTWEEIDHRNMDGLGAFITALEESGATSVPYPELRQPLKPDADAIQSAIGRAMERKGDWKVNWKLNWKSEWEKSCDIPAGKNNIAWRIISPEVKILIESKSKEQSVSVNSYLLSTLNRVLGQHLTQKESQYFWGMPINMRGAVKMPEASQNHFSFISVKTSADGSAQDIHQEIKKQLKADEHWAYWDLFRFMASSPDILSQAVSGAGDDTRIGTFSNLGEWNIEDLNENDMWVFVPSITPDTPIAIGVITLNGNIGLAMHVDPSLPLSQKNIDEIMDKWIQQF